MPFRLLTQYNILCYSVNRILAHNNQDVYQPENQPKEKEPTMKKTDEIKKEYNIAELNPQKNPYAKKMKTKISITLSNYVIDYFKEQSAETGIPYQTLINLYLTDCADNKRKLSFTWK